ncbi:hypothetical protein C9J21_21875, partial [Photobacterium phosphoreum]|uniref:conjugal transfer protein TraG N-terminal domain-containing protein n=1 Tax=Photobacterium phosphoreum TaxID=659 RepID=UPI000D3FFE98
HSNATAAQLNYANTKSEIQNEQMWISLGLMAQKYIPELHSLLFLMILVSPIFVMLLAMLPSMTIKVLTSYVYGYVYLATWPPLFVIINYFMTKTLEMESIDIARMSHGLTFSNANEIYHSHIYFAAISGWLLSTVPFIAPYIVKGGASIMGSLSMQVAGMVNSSSGQAASENTTGNYNLGNTSMDNHNANKTDLRHMMQTHGTSVQNTDGTMTTQLADSMVYNAQQSMSQSPFSINGQKAVTETLTHSLSNAHKQTQTEAANYTQSTSAVAHDLQGLAQSSSSNDNYGHNTSNGLSANQQKNVNQMQSSIQEYAKAHNVSSDTAWKAIIGGYGDIHGNLGLELFGTGGKEQFGVKGSLDKSWGGGSSDNTNSRHASSAQKSFNEAYTSLRQSSMTDTTGHQNSKTTQALHNFNHDSQNLVSSAQNYSHAASKEQALSNTLQQVKSGTLQVNDNLLPQFQSYLEQNPHAQDHVEQIMNGSNPVLVQERQGYVQQFLKEKVDSGDMSIFTGGQKHALNESPQSFGNQAGQAVDDSLQHYSQSEKVAQHSNSDVMSQFYDDKTANQHEAQTQVNITQRDHQIDSTHIDVKPKSEPKNKSHLPPEIEGKLKHKLHAEGADWKVYLKD